MKIENIFLLVQVDGKIYQAVLTEDQDLAIKSILIIMNDTVRLFNTPIETIETVKPKRKTK